MPLEAFEYAIKGYRGGRDGSLIRSEVGTHVAAGIARVDDPIDISMAISRDDLRSAEDIVRKQYVAKGFHYHRPAEYNQLTEHWRRGVSIIARSGEHVIGTVTLGIDSPAGLHVDDSYREHVDIKRAHGHKIGEVVRLAVPEGRDSRRVLAALFGGAHCLMELHELIDVFIEVNPRHVGFYHRAFCFAVAGPQKTCPRVGAPAVLMRLSVTDLTDKIAALETGLGRLHGSHATGERERRVTHA